MSEWYKSGSPWIWLSAGAISVCLCMLLGLLFWVAFNGLAYFWPAEVVEVEYSPPNARPVRLIGEIYSKETVPAFRLRDMGIPVPKNMERVERWVLKVGNRDAFGRDFQSVELMFLKDIKRPENAVVLERREWGNAYGVVTALKSKGQTIATGEDAWKQLAARLEKANELATQRMQIEKKDIGAVNYKLERLRLKRRGLELKGERDSAKYEAIEREKETLNKEYDVLRQKLVELGGLNQDSLVLKLADGQEREIPLQKIVRAYRPNSMGLFAKGWFYLTKIWEFLSEDPREANSEGGVFPCIFGTVVMVLIMSILATPLGIITAVYLKEYARQGVITRLIRIAVNNLAGVPSIVYGVFGLGFFVYSLGGNIDRLFYAEALPQPTFGTPGLLWASVTLALLTMPVVIVSTEEGLSRIPRAIREGSLALGATKAETLWRIVLPIASPAMMTGLILAVARAAGEVAPLMLVGVVKLAPALPVDGNFPFLHLERKFMHLGFHIYDVGFQSPNIEAARPLVYASALLLILLVIALNMAAIAVRNRLRQKYKALEG
ncbi:MAG: phosphate ABC transporter permease PstA [Dissulfuribacterales bacterium]